MKNALVRPRVSPPLKEPINLFFFRRKSLHKFPPHLCYGSRGRKWGLVPVMFRYSQMKKKLMNEGKTLFQRREGPSRYHSIECTTEPRGLLSLVRRVFKTLRLMFLRQFL